MIKIFNTLFKIDFWHVFIAKVSLKEFFDSKGKVLFKKAISIKNDKFSFFGDPFIIKTKNKIQILVEDFSFFSGAKISLLEINKNNRIKTKILSNKHFSYPQNFNYKKNTYFIPEMSEENRNKIWKFINKKKLKDQNYLLGYKVIDPTVFKYKGYFWLFCCLKKHKKNDNNLHLFYSKNPTDSWINHKKNPILKNIKSVRPAGSIIFYNKKIYRPSQNITSNGYGSELIINKIEHISINDYKEKKVFTIKPSKPYQGFHHISYSNNYMAFDQKKIVYSFLKPIYYLIKSFR